MAIRSFGLITYLWKGEFASPPANPSQNWVYRNTTDKKVYLYDSGAWKKMIEDGRPGTSGDPGEPGNNGSDGFSPTITVKEDTATSYILTIMYKDSAGTAQTYDTPNLRGDGGMNVPEAYFFAAESARDAYFADTSHGAELQLGVCCVTGSANGSAPSLLWQYKSMGGQSKWVCLAGGESGTGNYNDLTDKPAFAAKYPLGKSGVIDGEHTPDVYGVASVFLKVNEVPITAGTTPAAPLNFVQNVTPLFTASGDILTWGRTSGTSKLTVDAVAQTIKIGTNIMYADGAWIRNMYLPTAPQKFYSLPDTSISANVNDWLKIGTVDHYDVEEVYNLVEGLPTPTYAVLPDKPTIITPTIGARVLSNKFDTNESGLANLMLNGIAPADLTQAGGTFNKLVFNTSFDLNTIPQSNPLVETVLMRFREGGIEKRLIAFAAAASIGTGTIQIRYEDANGSMVQVPVARTGYGNVQNWTMSEYVVPNLNATITEPLNGAYSHVIASAETMRVIDVKDCWDAIQRMELADFSGPYAATGDIPSPPRTDTLYLVGNAAPYQIYIFIDGTFEMVGNFTNIPATEILPTGTLTEGFSLFTGNIFRHLRNSKIHQLSGLVNNTINRGTTLGWLTVITGIPCVSAGIPHTNSLADAPINIISSTSPFLYTGRVLVKRETATTVMLQILVGDAALTRTDVSFNFHVTWLEA